jgi:hypothetical protein
MQSIATKPFEFRLMLFTRLTAFALIAFALAGCCASGTGCPVSLPADLAAWDGQGVRPDDGAAPPKADTASRPASKKRIARPKTEIIVGPVSPASADAKPQMEQWWAEKEAADKAADAKLTRQLKICSDCLPPSRSRDDDAVSSARR